MHQLLKIVILLFVCLKDNITVNAICFLDVKIMSVIEVIVLFLESMTHTVLMILKKLNTN